MKKVTKKSQKNETKKNENKTVRKETKQKKKKRKKKTLRNETKWKVQKSNKIHYTKGVITRMKCVKTQIKTK